VIVNGKRTWREGKLASSQSEVGPVYIQTRWKITSLICDKYVHRELSVKIVILLQKYVGSIVKIQASEFLFLFYVFNEENCVLSLKQRTHPYN